MPDVAPRRPAQVQVAPGIWAEEGEEVADVICGLWHKNHLTRQVRPMAGAERGGEGQAREGEVIINFHVAVYGTGLLRCTTQLALLWG